MTTRRMLLAAYRHLLQLYPREFRARFAAEMLECAEAAEIADWALILADTSLAIVRSWMEASLAGRPRAVPAGSDAYLELGESGLNASRLLQGFALSVALTLGLCYISSFRVWRLPPPDEPCHPIASSTLTH
jgi:hypothetical protein